MPFEDAGDPPPTAAVCCMIVCIVDGCALYRGLSPSDPSPTSAAADDRAPARTAAAASRGGTADDNLPSSDVGGSGEDPAPAAKLFPEDEFGSLCTNGESSASAGDAGGAASATNASASSSDYAKHTKACDSMRRLHNA